MATTIHSLAYKITADTVGMTRGLTATRKELAAAKRQMKETETPLERFKRQVQESATLLGKGAITAEQHRRKVQMLGKAYEASAVKLKAHTLGLTQANAATAKLGATTKAATASTSAFGGMFGKVFAAGAAIGVLRNASNTAREFAQNMAKSTAIMSGVTVELRKEMERTAKQVGTDTVFSARQAAEAYFFLASASLDAKQSIAALPTVAQFAQAGMFDLATATDLLTDAQSALALDREDVKDHLKEMTRLSDLLVKSNKLSNATIQQFSEALTNKAAVGMRRFNIDVRDGMALLAVFAKTGFAKGAEAGTKFDQVIRELSIKAKTNAAAFREMNIEVFNQKTGAFELVGALTQLDAKLSKLTPEGKTQALLDLGFTAESLSSIGAVLGLVPQLKEFRKEMENVSGFTKQVAEDNVPALEKSINRLSGAWEKLVTSMAATKAMEGAARQLELLGNLANAPFEKKGSERVIKGTDAYSAFIIDMLSKASGEQLYGGRNIRGGLEDLRQSFGRAFAGDGEFAPYRRSAQGANNQTEVRDVKTAVDKSREDANRNAANIAARLDRLVDVTRANAQQVGVELPPGGRP